MKERFRFGTMRADAARVCGPRAPATLRCPFQKGGTWSEGRRFPPPAAFVHSVGFGLVVKAGTEPSTQVVVSNHHFLWIIVQATRCGRPWVSDSRCAASGMTAVFGVG